MAAGTPLSAKSSVVRVNNNVLYGASWEFGPEANLIDTSNFEGNGFEDQIAGLRKCTVKISGWWDAGANPHDAPLNIQDGQVLLNVKLFSNGVGSPFWFLPASIVSGVPVTVDVHDDIKYSFTIKAKGSFSYSTGNAA